MKSTIAFLLALLPAVLTADQATRISVTHTYVLVAEGSDQEVKTPDFKVGAHWKVTCTAAKAGPDFGVQIFAIPSAGTHNLEVLNMTSEGKQSEYVRDGGTWKLHIIGFGASFNVTVEESD